MLKCWWTNQILQHFGLAPKYLIDPEKINPFLDNLIDPFKEKPNDLHKKMHLETLWFQAGEQEWLDERQLDDYIEREMKKDCASFQFKTTDCKNRSLGSINIKSICIHVE